MTQCAPQAGVIMMTSVADVEWAAVGIRVNAIARACCARDVGPGTWRAARTRRSTSTSTSSARRLGTRRTFGTPRGRPRVGHRRRYSRLGITIDGRAHSIPRLTGRGRSIEQENTCSVRDLTPNGYTVSNLERFVEFYCGMLGLEIVAQQERRKGRCYLWAGDLRLPRRDG